jgi:hypothetical protein
MLNHLPTKHTFQPPVLIHDNTLNVSGGNLFFCNWCGDTGKRIYSEGSHQYEGDCTCLDDPFYQNDYEFWLIMTGQVPPLEGV